MYRVEQIRPKRTRNETRQLVKYHGCELKRHPRRSDIANLPWFGGERGRAPGINHRRKECARPRFKPALLEEMKLNIDAALDGEGQVTPQVNGRGLRFPDWSLINPHNGERKLYDVGFSRGTDRLGSMVFVDTNRWKRPRNNNSRSLRR